MKVKKRNLIELILQILIPILAFIPAFYKSEDWVDDFEYVPKLNMHMPVKALKYSESHSLFDSLFNTDGIIMVVGLLLFAAFICGIVFYTLQFVAKDNKRNWILPSIISCCEMILLVICSVLIATSDWTYSDTEYRFSLQATAYIMMLVLIALIVVSIWGYLKTAKKGIIEETPKIIYTKTVNDASNADELKKLKDLLDSGVITQEEFDAKKKQLLGL